MIYFHLAAQRFRTHLKETEDTEELEHTCAAIDALTKSEQFLESNVKIPLIFQQLAVTLEKLLVRALQSARKGLTRTHRESFLSPANVLADELSVETGGF